jgi:hypothetical protein
MAKQRRFTVTTCVLTVALMVGGILADCSDYQPSPENLQARREFQDAKFGMFIHWGVYSVLACLSFSIPKNSTPRRGSLWPKQQA